MRQIKTVIYQVLQSTLFDAEINRLLAEGWQIKRKEVLKIPDAPSEAFITL